MNYFKASDPIEYKFSTYTTLDYAIYTDGNLIYSGKVYPYPNTSTAVIILNDIVENYINSDDFSFDGGWIVTGTDNTYHKVLPNMSVEFLLEVSGTYDYEFTVDLMYLKIGDSTSYSGYGRLKKQSISLNTFLYPIFKALSTGQLTYNLKLIQNGTNLVDNSLTVTVSEGEIFALKIPLNTITGYTGVADTVKISDSFGVQYEYKISGCPKYTVYWFNDLGGIDLISGNQSSKMNSTSIPIDYKKNYRSFNGTDMVGSSETFGVNRTLVTTTDKYVIQTELLTIDQHKAIESIYSSTKIWIYDFSDGKYYSVICTDNQFDEKIFRVDKLTNRTINFEKTINNRRR